jgi:hypothetical protein
MILAASKNERNKQVAYRNSVYWMEKQRKGQVIAMKRSKLWLGIVVSLFIPALAIFSGCGSSSTDGGGGTFYKNHFLAANYLRNMKINYQKMPKIV